jgi:RecB family endonuclease NucS
LNNASIPTIREIAGSISEYAFNKLEGLEDFDDKEIHRLLNGGFSTLQMQSIIDLCNIQAIANSKTNSDIVADVYMSSPWEIDPDKIFAVSGNISELKKKTQLFTVLIKEKKNSELIAKCITLLPEEYHAIAEKRRQPKIVI